MQGTVNWKATFIRLGWAFAGGFVGGIMGSAGEAGVNPTWGLIGGAAWAGARAVMLIVAQKATDYEAKP